MANKKHIWILYVIILVLAAMIAGIMFYMIPQRYRLNQVIPLSESTKAIRNPLMGYAPSAKDVKEGKEETLVYMNLLWSDWEPEEGQYDIAAIEEMFHIKEWKSQHKHAVLRFVCDKPGSERHMDIPEWLYDKTGDGQFYDHDYGKGYSPNYENNEFIACHEHAIKALAEYCNRDSFVSYVELGSIGHWGEWHVNLNGGKNGMPDAEVCWKYVDPYSEYFENAKMLMRRNYIMAAEEGYGLFNDMAGSEHDTKTWLSWQQDGGEQETTGEPIPYQVMLNQWMNAPIGGEFTSSIPMEDMLETDVVKTIELVRDSHMTFIGPKSPAGEERSLVGTDMILKNIGYRYYIKQMETQFAFSENALKFIMTWCNHGVAPIYFDWPVSLVVLDLNGNILYEEMTNLDLKLLMPDQEITTEVKMPYNPDMNNGYMIGIKITDDWDGTETLELAMPKRWQDNIQIIYSTEEQILE